MTTVLGLNLGHDRAACVVENGKVSVAVAEERLDREKHSPNFLLLPRLAVSYCCSFTGLNLDSFDVIVVTSPERPILVQRGWVNQLRKLGLTRTDSVHTVSHHLAHAYSAYMMSPFEESLVWVADGAGSAVDGHLESESAYLASGLEIREVWARRQGIGVHIGEKRRSEHYPLSLGRKYEQLTSVLFGPSIGQCGKTMALASYGDPGRFAHHQLGRVNRERLSLEVDSLEFTMQLEQIRNTSPIPDFRTQTVVQGGIWADVAAHFQSFLENSLIDLIGGLKYRHSAQSLCLAGGVAYNCVANTKVVEATSSDEHFIQPAAGDEGQALGAALYGYYAVSGGRERYPMRHTYLGRPYDSSSIDTALHQYPHLHHVPQHDLYGHVSELLASGKIVAWFEGAAEFGPRALGHRSILASPFTAETRDVLNREVKRRELFRPFAPAVTDEDASKYFEISRASPFMLHAPRVREHYRSNLAGITHIDGTSRLQTVSATENPNLYNLLRAFERITGFPIIVNTSFNADGEPIVETPDDALRSFVQMDIDALVLGDHLVIKNSTPKAGANENP